MKKTKKILFALLIPISIVMLHGCYPYEDVTLSDSDVVITHFNDEINFDNYKTYYMPNRVYPIYDSNAINPDTANPYQQLMLNTVEANMAAYGYTRVFGPVADVNPDVAVIMAVVKSTTISVGYYYPYYPYSGWGYWGWYYPYYPPVPYYTSYTTGTVLIEMIDPVNYTISNKGDTIPTNCWTAAINGILESSTSDMKARVTQTINQAFIQSPNLKTGN